MTEIEPLIKKAFENGEEFNLITAGTSMLPMLRDRQDTVVLQEKKGKLKKYDLPLYKRADGQFVLHRIVGIKKKGYVVSGDNHNVNDYPVTDDQIIAVVSAYVRDGKRISIDSVGDKIYCRWHCNIKKPLRKLRAIIAKAVKG